MNFDQKYKDTEPFSNKKKFYEVNNIEEELESDYASVFPEYHKNIEVIISEQNVLLDDVNNFLYDLKELEKESYSISIPTIYPQSPI